MRQVLRRGRDSIIVDEVADPVVQPHHVLVRPFYTLISSGTESADLHPEGPLGEIAHQPSHLRKLWEVMKATDPTRTLAEIRAKFSEYAVLGYSGAGVVVERHPSVSDVEVGELVAYGGEGTGHGETILACRNLVARVPAGVSPAHAAFTTLGSIAMNAVRLAHLGVGDVVAILGLGLVGQLVVQLVRAQGGVAIAIDVRPERVQLAEQLGAEHALLSGDDLAHRVKALTAGRGADVVIVAAASRTAEPAVQAIELCRERGKLVITGAVPLELPRDAMYMKELELVVSRAYGPGSYDPRYEQGGIDYPVAHVRWTENRNMEEFLRLLAAERVKVGPLVTHEFSLIEAPTAYETILDPTSESLAVLLRYPAAMQPEPVRTFVPKHKVYTYLAPRAAGDVRAALIGAGYIARWQLLPSLACIPGASLRAVCSASGARGKSYALRFGGVYSCTAYEEILADPDINLVLIATRHQHHAAQILAALRAGKHVFVEKPMAITEEECREIDRTVRETGRLLGVGFNRRFAPLYREQKRLLARRTGPAVIHCRVASPGMSGSFWAADPAIGGAVVGEGCHFVDLLYWLLEAEPVSVAAHSLPTGCAEPRGENNVAATFHFADGSIATLTYSTLGGRAASGELVEVFASGLAVRCENMKRLRIETNITRTRTSWFANKGYAAQMDAFIRAVRDGRVPEAGVRDGARATIGALRMLESARTGEPRTLELDQILSAEGPSLLEGRLKVTM